MRAQWRAHKKVVHQDPKVVRQDQRVVRFRVVALDLDLVQATGNANSNNRHGVHKLYHYTYTSYLLVPKACVASTNC